MCGICGIVNLNRENRINQDIIVEMRDIITHRGPDDHGIYINQNVGLGFRRLSIVDLSMGHQPISNEDDSIWLIFNGEIYNHQDLRKALIAKGHQYKTKTDTESILHLYEEEGIEGFKKLNGMFGIAIWDNRKKRLVLVRDRLGIKPVYYTQTKDSFIFGSEIKSILKSRSVSAEINIDGLEEYLVFRFLAGEKTMFKGIYNLLPGHILVLENGNITTHKFWDVPNPSEYGPITEKEAIDRLDELLHASVSYRLMSDVPLGTFCSGGVDSSLVSAYASTLSKLNLNTFSVGFKEDKFDESRYAKMVSDKYKTCHHTIVVDNKTFSDSLPQLTWHNDEPLNHANSVQLYHISKLAKQFVTVVLTGEGSDELFGGYPRYLISKIYSRLQGVPGFARNAFGSVVRLSNMRRLIKLSQFLPLEYHEMVALNSSFVTRDLAGSILNNSGNNSYLQGRLSLLPKSQVNPERLVETVMRLDLKTYLVSILNRQDKMSMAAAIEARVPFLDHRLVEWGVTVPASMKLSNFDTKLLVKKLAQRSLPMEIITRKKSGFGVPISEWLFDKHGLGRYLDLFSESRYHQRGYINSVTVKKLVEEHLSRKADHGEIIWELISLELWHRVYLEGEYSEDHP
jgi:asparagine synthase (glutamine-hydrolysing)